MLHSQKTALCSKITLSCFVYLDAVLENDHCVLFWSRVPQSFDFFQRGGVFSPCNTLHLCNTFINSTPNRQPLQPPVHSASKTWRVSFCSFDVTAYSIAASSWGPCWQKKEVLGMSTSLISLILQQLYPLHRFPD